MSELLAVSELDMQPLIDEIRGFGAVSIPILREGVLAQLTQEATTLNYIHEDEILNEGTNDEIRQDLDSFSNFYAMCGYDGQFEDLRHQSQDLLERSLKKLPEYPFATPLVLKRGNALRYRAGSIGITPHKDNFVFKNLIAIFIIGGEGRFFVCDDRQRTNSVELDTTPGNVILMRAPGFLPKDGQQYHYVTDITTDRYTFGLRQD